MRLLPLMIVALSAVTDAQASIVNDPEALAAKLEEMRVVRMEKHAAKEAYWADYRRNQESYKKVVCGKVYTNTGTYDKCKTITDYRYTGNMGYPR